MQNALMNLFGENKGEQQKKLQGLGLQLFAYYKFYNCQNPAQYGN